MNRCREKLGAYADACINGAIGEQLQLLGRATLRLVVLEKCASDLRCTCARPDGVEPTSHLMGHVVLSVDVEEVIPVVVVTKDEDCPVELI